MKRLILTGILAGLWQCPAVAQASLPDNLAPFVPEGYKELTTARGDLDADGHIDLLLAVRPIGEDTLDTDAMPPRRLMLLLRQQNGTLQLAAASDSALYRFGYDANFRDCLTGLEAGKGSFTIDHYGGFATRWGRSVRFRYEAASGNWFLAEDEHSSFESMHHEDSQKSDTYFPSDFGRISFTRFNIYKEPRHRARRKRSHR